MDEFDRQVTNAKQPYEPKPNFVEETMNHIQTQKPQHHWRMKFWIPVLASAAAVVAIAFVVLPKAMDNTNSPSDQNNVGQTSQSNAPLTAGTDNASLDSDLKSIQSSMNQANSDQNGAENALNDNQSQIAVPTD